MKNIKSEENKSEENKIFKKSKNLFLVFIIFTGVVIFILKITTFNINKNDTRKEYETTKKELSLLNKKITDLKLMRKAKQLKILNFHTKNKNLILDYFTVILDKKTLFLSKHRKVLLKEKTVLILIKTKNDEDYYLYKNNLLRKVSEK